MCTTVQPNHNTVYTQAWSMQSHIPPQTLLRYLAIQSIQISLAKVLTFKQLSQKYINRAFLDSELNFFFFFHSLIVRMCCLPHGCNIMCQSVYLCERKRLDTRVMGLVGTSAEFPPLELSSLSLHWKQSVPHHVNRAVLVNIEVTW